MKRLAALTRPKRSLIRKWIGYLAKNYINFISICLLLCSIFYFVSIQRVRMATLSSNPELFTDGEMVEVVRAIDGDEVRIKNSQGGTRLRILGIKSFDASERDMLLTEYGKIAVDYLEQEVVGKRAKLLVAEKRVDNKGRLLATLILEDNNADVAKTMVTDGLTLVYTKFSFPAMDDYLAAQNLAQSKKTGLWQNDRVAVRAQSMRNVWDQERNNR